MLTPITEEDLKKYGIAICLIKSAMTPEQFEEWYAGELARQRTRAEAREKEKNDDD